MLIRHSVWMWLFLMFASACGVEPGPTIETVEHQCVLCDPIDPNGGGGVYAETAGFLDDNFPGWQLQGGGIDCAPDGDGMRCDAYFFWGGQAVDHGCTEFPNGDRDCV